MEKIADLLAPFNLIGTVMSRERKKEGSEQKNGKPWYRKVFSRR
jgi:hypothetical protein